MTESLPPELMSPEDREARADQLEREVGREWLKYVITETGVITAPFVVFVVANAYGSYSRGAVIVVAGVALALSQLLLWYWLVRRIRPRRAEVEALRAVR